MAAGLEPEELRVWLKLKMYAGQRDFILGALKSFAMEHGLGDDLPRALELLAAEHVNGVLAVEVVQDMLPGLREIREKLFVTEADEALIREIGKRLEDVLIKGATAVGLKHAAY